MTSLDVQTHHQLPPPAPRLPASSCPLHPDKHVTGFCASCLRERLAGLETTSSSTSSTSARKSTSSTFKSLFFKVTGGGGGGGAQPTSSSFLRPDLHRCKSFSYGCGDGLYGPRASAAFEPIASPMTSASATPSGPSSTRMITRGTSMEFGTPPYPPPLPSPPPPLRRPERSRPRARI